MSARSLVFILFFASLISPARADWQYTKWKMNCQEIVSASQGQARELHGEDKEEKSNIHHFTTCAIAPYSASGFKFEVNFRSKPGRDELDEVYLELENSGGYQDLLSALTEKYGVGLTLPPEDQGLMGILQTVRWSTNDDVINLNRLVSIAGELVYIVYNPRPSGEGL